MDKSHVKEYKVYITWHSSSTYKDNGFQARSLSNTDDISKAISDAQEYILSKAGKNVSSDIVEVDCRDPEGVELTLIDLPGIVRTVGMGEDEDLGINIEALMQEYLYNERCVILAVAQGNVDFHNNQIIADAKKVDPSTERTIPVITKPDLIDKGAEGGVVDLLLGKKIQCNLGFHIVKCRGQEAVNNGVTMSECLIEEQKFFSKNSPWKEIDDRSLFGIKQLREKLASVQTDLLKKSIPLIENEMTIKEEEAIEHLKKLGNHLENDKMRRFAFSNYLNDLIRSIEENASGSQKTAKSKMWRSIDGFTLRSKIEDINFKFSEKLLGTKLASMTTIEVRSDVLVNIGGIEYKGTIHSMCKKGEEKIYRIDSAFASDKEKFTVKGTIHFPKEPKFISGYHFEYGNNSDKCGVLRSKINEDPNFLKWHTDDYINFLSNDVAVDHSSWLLNKIQKNKTRDLAIFPSTSLFNGIIRGFVSDEWATLAEQLVDDTAKIIDLFVRWIINEIVPESLPNLRHFFLKQLTSIMKISTEDGRRECQNLLLKEEEPYTQNHYLSENFMKERMSDVKRLLYSDLDAATIVDRMKNFVSHTQKISNDEFAAREMQTALSAYGKVAAKRVIDSVPMAIENQIAGQLAEQTRLENIDTMSNNEELLSLMSEPQDIANERKKWEEQKGKMTMAIKALNCIR
jgi:hypothetical protein